MNKNHLLLYLPIHLWVHNIHTQVMFYITVFKSFVINANLAEAAQLACVSFSAKPAYDFLECHLDIFLKSAEHRSELN